MDNTIENLVKINDNIEEKETIIEELKYLERIMPESNKQRFYYNILNLKTELNLNKKASLKEFTKNDFYKQSANYLINKNKISINLNQIKKYREISVIKKDPKYFDLVIKESILHELSHMASSSYDIKTKKTVCGFSDFPEEVNQGLTEGLTCRIAAVRYPNAPHKLVGYYPELCLVGQLEKIIGIDLLLDSYFNNKGTKELENRLVSLGLPKEEAFNLFRNIEFSFNINSVLEKNDIYHLVQERLLDIYDDQTKNNPNRLEELKIYQEFMLKEEDLHLGYEKRNITNLKTSINRIEWLKIEELKKQEEELKKELV